MTAVAGGVASSCPARTKRKISEETYSHRRVSFLHTQRRALERYGLKYTKELHLAALHQVWKHTGVRVQTLKDGASIWLVAVDGKVYPVLYDPRDKIIATMLPPTDIRLMPYNMVIGRCLREVQEMKLDDQFIPPLVEELDPAPTAEAGLVGWRATIARAFTWALDYLRR